MLPLDTILGNLFQSTEVIILCCHLLLRKLIILLRKFTIIFRELILIFRKLITKDVLQKTNVINGGEFMLPIQQFFGKICRFLQSIYRSDFYSFLCF